MFTTTSDLTFTTYDQRAGFCPNLRPPSPLPPPTDNTEEPYCPFDPGQLAFPVYSQWNHPYQLTTLTTRVRVVDANNPPNELVCVDVPVTPVEPHGIGGGYGYAHVLFWTSVGLTIGYWILNGCARLAAASRRVGWGNRGGWHGIQWAGTVLTSAISGERLSTSPSLLRFGAYFCIQYQARLCLTPGLSHSLYPGHNIPHPVVCFVGYDCCPVANLYL